MTQTNEETGTEWIFCRDINGRCSGLSGNTNVIEKVPKTISVHGKQIRGWMVKIVQEKSEDHVKLDYSHYSDE